MKDREADIIKIAAVLTAAPRWAGALMAADGVPVPPEWMVAWRIGAFGLSLGMAAVEGFAISFVFNAWRNQRDKKSDLLLWLAIIMLVDFGLILAPYIVANVSGQTIAGVLAETWLLWLWSAAVAASTGLVVGSVGYAQRDKPAPSGSKPAKSESKPASEQFVCENCLQPFANQSALNAHSPARCAAKLAENGREPVEEAVERR